MKILYGTGNPAKLSAMKRHLEPLDIEIIGLNDLGMKIPEVLEDGNTPLENARQKAKAYYKAFHIPVFSCDSGLYFENVPNEIQPGVHVITAYYKNAICFVLDDTRIFEAMEPEMESEKFIITTKPHSAIRKKGFPLDSLSIDIKTGTYFYDLPEQKLDQVVVKEGFLTFFQNALIALKD